MLVIGAKGFAKEVLELYKLKGELDNLYFFDNVSSDLPERLYGKFDIFRTLEDVENYFKISGDNRFTIAVGGPQNRIKLASLIENIGGKLTTLVSPNASIGHYEVDIQDGCNIMQNVFISNSVRIGKGSIVNVGATIGHDVTLGQFVEISPGVNISGNCEIGSGTVIGTNVTVIPKVKIGNNVVIGAGSMVKDTIPDNSIAIGFPARVLKTTN